MIKTLFIFTDMQFDECVINNGQNDPRLTATTTMTFFQKLKKNYVENGYSLPKVVFWNLRTSDTNSNAFPVKIDENNTAYVSGFSSTLLKVFMKGIDFNPGTILNEFLKPYDVVIDSSEI